MKIEMGKKYKTRDGKPVRILCVDRDNEVFKVVALVTGRYGEETWNYTAAGTRGAVDTGLDLVEVKPSVFRPVWSNGNVGVAFGDPERAARGGQSSCSGFDDVMFIGVLELFQDGSAPVFHPAGECNG
ncbi:hypothetical protein [Candidimonas nitroreducens]|uniref:Uncharacterized protein n=1 Tax=Candidimonas nitroreducens TaxID=683354 RepID=A0A225M6R2_9BURK|nr:hypothetical protein [Candidimonas nitroreducens]OWT55251.1 hypothetical protein CEY11_21310 [Candidimonas nitroreducens]